MKMDVKTQGIDSVASPLSGWCGGCKSLDHPPKLSRFTDGEGTKDDSKTEQPIHSWTASLSPTSVILPPIKVEREAWSEAQHKQVQTMGTLRSFLSESAIRGSLRKSAIRSSLSTSASRGSSMLSDEIIDLEEPDSLVASSRGQKLKRDERRRAMEDLKRAGILCARVIPLGSSDRLLIQPLEEQEMEMRFGYGCYGEERDCADESNPAIFLPDQAELSMNISLDGNEEYESDEDVEARGADTIFRLADASEVVEEKLKKEKH